MDGTKLFISEDLKVKMNKIINRIDFNDFKPIAKKVILKINKLNDKDIKIVSKLVKRLDIE